MMQEYQNSIYINIDDPTNAVIYDFSFVRGLFQRQGLTIVQIIPPEVRGFQWVVYASKVAGAVGVEFPEDAAPFGRMAPPD